MLLFLHHTDVRTALHAAAAFCLPPRRHVPQHRRPHFLLASAAGGGDAPYPRLLSLAAASPAVKVDKKPPICTADELHYAAVPGTGWRLALWRYTPSPEAPVRNHPLMLLSGVGTNAIGFDLAPGASFARHMSNQGFDTWIVELRGAGLSMREPNVTEQSYDKPVVTGLESADNGSLNGVLPVELQATVNTGLTPEFEISNIKRGNNTSSLNEPQLVTRLTDTFLRLAERLSGYLNEGQMRAISTKFLDRISKLLEDARLSERFDEIRENISGLIEARQNTAVASQMRDMSQRLVNMVEESQKSVSPQLSNLQERLLTTIEDFQKQLDLIVTYDWDFDNYLEEDVPAAMEYIKMQSKPKDGKLLAIGHSMGGILLYAMLSRCGFKGEQSDFAAVVTLASSVDYTTSRSSLKMLLPIADPAQALNVPVVPLGALLAAAYPLAYRPPYVLSWLNPLISAQDMILPELLEKFVLKNFCTIPAKLILQLATAFREGGLRNRTATFLYKDHLDKCNVPVLALAGDQDLICPPEAVYETVKLLPQHLVTYKVFGNPDGPHYAHYDLVGGRLAVDEVYPCIIEFLGQHDGLCSLQ